MAVSTIEWLDKDSVGKLLSTMLDVMRQSDHLWNKTFLFDPSTDKDSPTLLKKKSRYVLQAIVLGQLS